jgi:putative ABC transport system ATP-binding protein
MALLEIRKAGKVYGSQSAPVTALENISFSVEAGEFVALVGRSGCGKSTLLNLCGAMDFPSSGEISIDGQVTSRLSDAALTRLRREKIGFVFQSFQLLHTLTALANVEMPLLLARKASARWIAEERLRWVEMADFADRFPHQLSGGQQQRIAIARALTQDPHLVLADEPTGNLDERTGLMIFNLLSDLRARRNLTSILVTHNLQFAHRCDRVLRLEQGALTTI